jgi:hypothetical protein
MPERLDDADELVTRRERRLRASEISPSSKLGICEGDARGEDLDSNLSRPRFRDLGLDDRDDLGPAILTHDDALHVGILLPTP